MKKKKQPRMRICIFTNTFLPHVGGVARSVRTFLEDFRRAGHRVLVIAPEYEEGPAPVDIERSVERVPAWQKFNGSEFCVSLPLGAALVRRVARFQPEIIHAQHPFLLGDSALRLAARHGVPVVFTHHTLYEQYTHYMPLDSSALQAFVIELATRFANCCQGVIAPSGSVERLLVERGVTALIQTVPTGIDTRLFARASRTAWRNRLSVPDDAVVLGHVGRLAVEKNLPFLGTALARALQREPRAQALIVGDGPARGDLEKMLTDAGVADRAHFPGKLTGRRLRDAYAAMDVFVFSSKSETQGMVLVEAMATGCPVVALDASGVRDVVRDGVNGRLLPPAAKPETVARALVDAVRDDAMRARWRREARRTARAYDRRTTAAQAMKFYRTVLAACPRRASADLEDWEAWWTQFRDRVAIEGRMFSDKVVAAAHAIAGTAPTPEPTHAGRRTA
jgi:1,2-diacylglycerol 3-alpha-glucosyltransferase